MRLVPIKMPDDLYYDLSRFAEENDTTMSEVVRTGTRNQIAQNRHKRDVVNWMMEHIIERGDDDFSHLTDDELLYGEVIDQHGNKTWQKFT